MIAELETRVEQLRASEVDMKNLFYQEKEAHEVLEYDYKQLAYECDKHMELRIASDRDLVNCYKSLQKLNEDCEKLRAKLKELEDSSLGGPAERSSQSSGDVRQVLGEVDPQSDLGVHEVVLPKGSS
jgi:chromosome segregation ATPase